MSDDLISRQAAIDAIVEQTVYATKRELVERCDANISVENGWLGGICIALDTIEDLPSAQQWIPCSERLPEEGKEVLISTNGSIYTSEYDMIDGRPFWYETVEYRRLLGVVAWMPLPEPYKQEETTNGN